MNTRLETFVKENRKSFDVFEPSAGLWTKIEKDLNAKKKKEPIKLYLWMSAAAAIIMIVGLICFYKGKVQGKDLEIADVDSAYAKKEFQYAGLIIEKKDSLEIFAAANPELYKKFTTDLKKLDEDFERLKTELPSSPNQLFVVKAMVKNRELQLQLVKQQLMIINQVDSVNRVSQI